MSEDKVELVVSLGGNGSYHYALEKLWQAVDVLAAGSESLRERLMDAAIALNVLKANDFPPEIRDDFVSLMQELTCKPAKGSEGPIVATIRGMRNYRLAEYAKLITDLCFKLSEFNWSAE